MKIVTSIIIGLIIIVISVLALVVVFNDTSVDINYCCTHINETDICDMERCKSYCENNTINVCNVSTNVN